MQPNSTESTPQQSVDPTGEQSATPIAEQQELPEPPDETAEGLNSTWAKGINTSNRVTLVIAGLLMAFVNIPLAVASGGALDGFLMMMFVAVGIFLACVLFDLDASQKLRYSRVSKKDAHIRTLVDIRNVIVILNVIPLIQLFGLLAAFVAPIIILMQVMMVFARLDEFNRENQS